MFLCGWIVCADSNRFSLMLEESTPTSFTVNGESAGVRYRRVEATVIPEASPHRICGSDLRFKRPNVILDRKFN